MTIEEKIKYVRRMIANDKGDDLEPATSAFRNLTPQELDQQYGHSGETCRQILDGYRKGRERHTEVTAWLEELMRGTQ